MSSIPSGWMQSKAAAECLGCSLTQIRVYKDRGLLRPMQDERGDRWYDPNELDALDEDIEKARDAGVSPEELREARDAKAITAQAKERERVREREQTQARDAARAAEVRADEDAVVEWSLMSLSERRAIRDEDPVTAARLDLAVRRGRL